MGISYSPVRGLATIILGLLAALALALAPLALAAPANAAAAVHIQTVSNRADLVSGGDVLVRINGTHRKVPRVRAGGRDVTKSFALRPNGRVEGLVTGLPNGRTRLTARLPNGRGARLTVTNHPASGPVIAGPQTQPWVCRTEQNGLTAPLDPTTCAVPPKITYVYRSSDPTKHGFDAYDPAHPPTDVATTTTDQGRTVPFVVRVETGVMDRGIYAVALLDDPAKPWAPWAPQPGWNRKVLWPFGGDCKPYHAQDPPVDPLGGMRLDQPGSDTYDAGVDEVGGSIYGNGNAVGRAVEGLRGRRQREQQVRLAVQQRRDRRVDSDAEGAHRGDVRPDPLHDRRRLLGRLDAAAPDRLRLPRPARRHPADGELPGHLGDRAGGRGLPPAEPLLRERHRPYDHAGPAGCGHGLARRRGLPHPVGRPARPRHAGRRQLRRHVARPGQRSRLRARQGPRVRPEDQPGRRPLHPAGLPGVDLRAPRERRLREPPVRQRRSAVRTARAAVGPDHAGAVRGHERARRRARHRLDVPARALAGRPRRAHGRIQGRADLERPQSRARADRRHSRAGQRRDPRRLPLVRDARAARRGKRAPRQPGHLGGRAPARRRPGRVQRRVRADRR